MRNFFFESTVQLFNEGTLSGVLRNQERKLKEAIAAQDRNYLLNANESDLIRYFTDLHRIEPLVLAEEKIYGEDSEEMIPAERFDQFLFNVTPGNSYRKQVIRYHLPFTGEEDLLKLQPSTRILWTQKAIVGRNEILFDVVNFSDDPERIKAAWEQFLSSLRTQVAHSTAEVEQFNKGLETQATSLIQSRKAEILKTAGVLGALGVPIKKASDVPSTFSVPLPKKKEVFPKPQASTAPFVPEPKLSDEHFQDILKIIHDVGIEIERHPSIHTGKDEETLRDHLLMVLSPHFSSVSGETFNKTGKTDILIRHEGKNLFVAECGMWKGAKNFSGKIDQLLAYLTWRDSKAAVISFVKNKEFTAVLDTIRAEVPKHECFVRENTPAAEAWLRYEFCLKDDRSRPVQLAVLCFHFPE